jgi:cation transport ATPase
MSGTLLLGECLAAVVLALMYAGGQYLESFAERRATRAEKSGTQFADAQWPSLSIDRRSTLWTR